MIWRLMASVLMLSDAGAISLVSDKSDWPSQAQCEQIRADFYTAPPPHVFNGKRITTKIQAQCVPVGGPDGLIPPGALPPPGALLPPPPLAALPIEPWRGPYYGPSPMAPSIYDNEDPRLYRRGDLPPWQRLAPY